MIDKKSGCYFRSNYFVKISTLNLPTLLKVIKDGAFSEIDHLTTVNFNEGLQTIETNAFSGCSALTTVKVEGDDFDIYNSINNVGVNEPTDAVSVTDAEFLTKLKSTYVNKLWFRLPLV